MKFNINRKGIRRGLAMLAVAVTVTSLGACSGGGAKGGSSSEALNVWSGVTGTLNENFNPFYAAPLAGTLGIIYEPLFWYNFAEESDPTPMLATDYSWNEDGSELSITTRDGVKWQDGEDFSAKDVAYTFNLIADNASINSAGLDLSAEATDDTHVTITFGAKDSYTQEAQIIGNTPIVPEHVWSKVSDPGASINENPIGTGPYQLDKFTAQSYSFKAYDGYWNKAPKVSEVRFISLSDNDSAASAFLAGKVDWMNAYIPNLDSLIKGKSDLKYVNNPSYATTIDACSNADLGCEGPQTDPAVRQALYYAMNRSQLIKLAGGGFAGQASPTLLKPGRDDKWISDDSLNLAPATSDIDKANEILDTAGWVKSDDGIRVKDGQRLSMTIQTVTGWSDYISINETFRQQVLEAGIELKPTQVASNENDSDLQKGEYQLALDSFAFNASTDPYFSYIRLATENTAKVGETAVGRNYARYSNSKVDDAIKAAAATNDESVKKEQYAIIQQEMFTDMPYIPVYLNQLLSEYSTAKATGWVTDDDPYAIAASWKGWDVGIVLHNLEPVSK